MVDEPYESGGWSCEPMGGENKSKDTVRKYSATLNNGKLRNCAHMCLTGKRKGTPFPWLLITRPILLVYIPMFDGLWSLWLVKSPLYPLYGYPLQGAHIFWLLVRIPPATFCWLMSQDFDVPSSKPFKPQCLVSDCKVRPPPSSVCCSSCTELTIVVYPIIPTINPSTMVKFSHEARCWPSYKSI